MGEPSLPKTPIQSTETTKLDRPVYTKIFSKLCFFLQEKCICKLTYDMTRQYMTANTRLR